MDWEQALGYTLTQTAQALEESRSESQPRAKAKDLINKPGNGV
jgi:hypothetical protein